MIKDANLTKADTVALWYAVDSYALQVRLMRTPPCDLTPEQHAAERDRVLVAKRALRKVNQIRKTTASRLDANRQELQVKRKTAGDAGL